MIDRPVYCYGYSFISLGLVGNLILVTRRFERILFKNQHYDGAIRVTS